MTNDKNLRTTSRGYQLKQGELDIKDPAQWPVKPFTLNAPEATSINIAYNYIRTGIKGTNVGVYNNNYYHTYFGINETDVGYGGYKLAENNRYEQAWMLGHRSDKTIGFNDAYWEKSYDSFWKNKPNGELTIKTRSDTNTNKYNTKIYIFNNSIGSDIHITGVESKNISKHSNQLVTFWMNQSLQTNTNPDRWWRTLNISSRSVGKSAEPMRVYVKNIGDYYHNEEKEKWADNKSSFQNGVHNSWSAFYNALKW